MTIEEYQKELLDLTSKLLGNVHFSFKNPFVLRMQLPHHGNAAMKLVLGFTEDVDDA